MGEPVTVGQALRTARLAAGLTQSEVASKLGIRFQQLSGYERDRLKISEMRMMALAKALPASQIEQLQETWAWASHPILADDCVAARQHEWLMAGRMGTITALSGVGAGFLGSSMLGVWRKFLRHEHNQIVFITPTVEEKPSSPAQGLAELQKVLIGRNVKAKNRTSFYSPVLPPEKSQKGDITPRLLPLCQLLHPLTATVLFEPKDQSCPSSGLLYMQTTPGKASKGEYTWMRASSDFLGRLSSLLRATLWADDRDKLLTKHHALLPR